MTRCGASLTFDPRDKHGRPISFMPKYSVTCELPSGHTGAHADHRQTWTREPADQQGEDA